MNWIRKVSSGRDTDEFQHVESHGKRVLNLPNLIDEETGWYRAWYFLARSQEALARAQACDEELTLVTARLGLSEWGRESRLRLYATLRLGLMEREPREVELLFGRLSEDEFAIGVYGTDQLAAAAAAERLRRQLETLSAETGVATFPEDGSELATLLNNARRGVVRPPNVVDFEAFRRRRQPRAA